MAYPNEVYTAFSFLGFIMCIIPFPCHIKAWNIGTCLFLFWTGTGCLMSCINSIVWHGNVINWAPIWCEICTRFSIASSFGIPASFLCINRRLYLVHSAATEHRTGFDKKNTIIVDLVIGLFLPLLSLPIYYVSQGHRFNILEDIGCGTATYNSWVALVSIDLPPVLIGLVSGIYGVHNVIAINRMRARLKQLIRSRLNVSYGLYFRLMAMGAVEALLTVPITTLYVALNATKLGPLRPWISWGDTHSNFNRFDPYPATIWRADPTVMAMIELTRWLYVTCAILFFIFFGVAEEVRRFYGSAFQNVCERIGIRRNGKSDVITFKAGSLSKTTAGDDSFINTISTKTHIGEGENGGDEWVATRTDISTLHVVQDHQLDHSIHVMFPPTADPVGSNAKSESVVLSTRTTNMNV